MQEIAKENSNTNRTSRKFNIFKTVLMAVLLMGLSLWCIFGKKKTYSESERRVLAKFPQISQESVMSGGFAKDFEAYAVDNFPKRDAWRMLKAYTRLGLFMQKDNNGLYLKEKHLSKLEYPLNMPMLDHAIALFTLIREKYLTNNQIYFGIIPDKNFYIADLKFDYQKLSDYMAQGLSFAKQIKMDDLLCIDDYYFTDTHWRQDKIADVAERILVAMDEYIQMGYEYTSVKLDTPFNGVYVGQAAMHVKPDTITYLANDVIYGLKVEGAKAVYDLEKLKGKDPYEMFLSGNQPLITIKNPKNQSGKRLIIFRDSFGSSIAPLLAQGYTEVVLIDLRYVMSNMLDKLVDFKDADVLFLYSSLVLNNSLSLK